MERVEVSGTTVGPPPQTKPIKHEKYWVQGGWARIDLTKEPDVDPINLVDVIEAHRVWEHLKLPIRCAICKDRKAKKPFLEQVHWSYQHCVDCKDVFVCAECLSTDEYRRMRNGTHAKHTFIPFTTRPLSAPLYDGSDLQHLQLFKESKTASDFFQNFPWFFHCFSGMDECREHNQACALAQIMADTRIKTRDKAALMERQLYPTDWYIRTFGQGEWQMLLQNLTPLISARLHTAETSKRLHSLLVRFQLYLTKKVIRYGPGDIPPLPEAYKYASQLPSLMDSIQDYLRYSIPLQYLKIIEEPVNQQKLLRLLADPGSDYSDEQVTDRIEAAKETNSAIGAILGKFGAICGICGSGRIQGPLQRCRTCSTRGDQQLPLTNMTGLSTRGAWIDSLEEDIKLWEMFCVIFRGSPAFNDLKESAPKMMSDLTSFFLYMKPTWHTLLSRDYHIKELVWSLQYHQVPEIPFEGLRCLGSTDLTLWSSSHPHKSILERAEYLRCRGDYETAIRIIKTVQSHGKFDLETTLLLQQIYLSQGYYQHARIYLPSTVTHDIAMDELDTIFAEHEQSRGFDLGKMSMSSDEEIRTLHRQPIAKSLLDLISSYADCFVRGRWEIALHDASRAFDKHLNGWQSGDENVALLVHLELYYHRIVLQASRDQNKHLDTAAALVRLRSIRHRLCGMQGSITMARLAWDVMSVEFELEQRTGRAQYLDIEDAYSVPTYSYASAEVLQTILEFRSSKLMMHQKNLSSTVHAETMMLEAESRQRTGNTRAASQIVDMAEKLFTSSSDQEPLDGDVRPHAGLLDVEAFRIRSLAYEASFSRLHTLYRNLEQRRDIRRMRELRKHGVFAHRNDPDSQDWLLFQRLSMRDLSKEAGDNIMYERWNLRKYAADHFAVASIDSAEKIIRHDDTVLVHSNLLATIASFNLSRAYCSVGNYFEAALNALLHYGLSRRRADTESLHRAILNVLSVFEAAVLAREGSCETVLLGLAEQWTGWLTESTYWRWSAGGARPDEIVRFIEAACFLPNLSFTLGHNQNSSTGQSFSPMLTDKVIGHLQIAFGLYETLPTYLASIVLPKLSISLGAVAVYIGNKELAIRTYWKGLKSAHSQDLFSRSNLQLQAGRLMTRLGEEDPEHWAHVVPAGRKLLSTVAGDMLLMRHFTGAYVRACDANTYHLSSLVAEARARKLVFDRETEAIGHNDADIHKHIAEIKSIIALTNRAKTPLYDAQFVILEIAQMTSLSSPFEASQNMSSLLSTKAAYKSQELALELSLIEADLEVMCGRSWGLNLWLWVQRFKSSVLHNRLYSMLVPRQYLAAIEADPTASGLYQEEQRLIQQGPQTIGDIRLELCQHKMRQNQITDKLMQHRRGTRSVDQAALKPLAEIARTTLGSSRDVILIDWIRFVDYFLIICYNVTQDKLSSYGTIKDCSVNLVESWIEEHVKIPPKQLPNALDSSEVFKSLYPLVRHIKATCKPGDLLVFSPSQQLNAIPLHAIPYSDESDEPVIHYHPIVYTPSNGIIQQCLMRAMERKDSELLASLFGRWGSDNTDSLVEEERIEKSIRETARDLEAADIKCHVVTGASATAESLRDSISHASILHFHGHVNERDLNQHLVLEPSDIQHPAHSAQAPRNSYRYLTGGINIYHGTEPQLQRGTYGLQDVFATEIRASLVVLLGCGSGTQLVSKADDAIGLVGAFFAARATSVIAALWSFESTDAAQFSESFYKEAFVKQKQRSFVNLAEAFQLTMKEMRACQRPRCKQRPLEKRFDCHSDGRASPYHWAQFVLWGSWFCKSGENVDSDQEMKPTDWSPADGVKKRTEQDQGKEDMIVRGRIADEVDHVTKEKSEGSETSRVKEQNKIIKETEQVLSSNSTPDAVKIKAQLPSRRKRGSTSLETAARKWFSDL